MVSHFRVFAALGKEKIILVQNGHNFTLKAPNAAPLSKQTVGPISVRLPPKVIGRLGPDSDAASLSYF
jgi:hypothetical protein